MKTATQRFLLVAAAGAAACAAYGMMPADVPELARRTVGIFAAAAVLWSTEAIPLYATSFCVVGVEILLLAEQGGLARQGGLSSDLFLSPFASGIIILFMGGFLLSKAMTKHQLDAVIARKLLHPFARSPLGLIYGILGVTAFFSMWMSNTATAAMMMAVVMPMLRQMPPQARMGTAMVLAVPFGANIGGLGTPIGTPPNAICLANMRAQGWDVGFVQWMAAAVPLVVLLLGIAGILLWGMFRPEPDIVLTQEEDRAKPISPQGWMVLGILGLSIGLWLTQPWHGIRESVVALIAAALLTACGMLDRTDVDSIDWNILILMWGGLALSNAMEITQLTAWIGNLPFVSLTGWGLPIAFVLLAMGLSTFMSNTAAANLIIPIAMVVSGTEPLHLAVLTAFACSFAMALPISTPPNAIAFASGRIASRHMLLAGGALSLLGVILLLAGYQVILPLVFR
jgi:solute carrier family 13 (sodium-dependent dicarboxylate transporter), member 2/3/5